MAQRVQEIESDEIIDEKKVLKEAEEKEKQIKAEIKAAKEAEKEEKKEKASGAKGKIESKKPIVRVKKHGKKYKELKKKIDKNIEYTLDDAIKLVKETSTTKFDASIEFHAKIDKKQENVRGVVKLPGGTAKEKEILVIDASNAEEMVEKIRSGKAKFDLLVAHPQAMPKLAQLAKILGPKGQMPNPKSGTVSDEPEEVANEFRSGKVEFKADKSNIVHITIGRVSFADEKIKENFEAIISALPQAKIQSIYLATSMGPSIRVEI